MSITASPNKFYSPLRYPGGKACLSGFISNVIKTNDIRECNYVEPFAGGSGAALTMLFMDQVDTIQINDLDRAIYSFWRSILTRTEDFVCKIEKTPVTIIEWNRQKEIYRNRNSRQFELGFATFFLNRANRSGIIEGGVIGGNNQTGKWLIDARFNKRNLIERIIAIASYKSRIKVTNDDGIELMKKIYRKPNQFVYLDPPYFVKGSSLYLNHYKSANHIRLAQFLNSHNSFSWMLTYDNVPEIKSLYSKRRVFDFKLSYHLDIPKMGNEVLVLSDKVTLPQS